MNVCDLNTGLDQLTRAISELNDQWTRTKAVWNDPVGQQFDQTHLAPLPARLKLLVTAIHELRASVSQAQRELDDPADSEAANQL